MDFGTLVACKGPRRERYPAGDFSGPEGAFREQPQVSTCGGSAKENYHNPEGVDLQFGPFRAAERFRPRVPWVSPTATQGLPLRGTGPSETTIMPKRGGQMSNSHKIRVRRIRERLLRDLQEPQQEGENVPAAELARRRGLEW